MRLIDADALRELIDGGYVLDFEELPETKRVLLRMIDQQETIEPAPYAERRQDEKKIELKPCPFRIHGERTASMTVYGEFYYNETFMPCMGEECICYYDSGDEIKCCRDNISFILAWRKHDEKTD